MKAKTKFSIVFFLVLSISISLVISDNFANSGVTNENSNAQVNDKIKSDLGNKIENNPIEKQRVIIKVNEEQKSRIKNKFSDKFNDITDEQILSAELDSDEINNLANDSDVLEIWPDRVTQSFLDQSVYQIHADYAWNLSLNGSGIKIAILDTGVAANHPMLNGRVILQADFTGDGVSDNYGHGTHVAGIAAGNGNYTGVASGALIYNGKVLDDSGSGYLSWLLKGIDWAMDPDGNPSTDDGADIISLSLGATYSGEPEELLNAPEVEKVREAVNKGIIVVIASGNCGSGCNGFYGVTTPGITPEAITVGAVNDNNEWASFSGGDIIDGNVKPDVVAPGVGICSSVPSGYECMSGTSMATPHVAGAATLLLQKNNTLTPYDVKEIINKGTLDLGSEGKDIKYGSGLIDISKILSFTNISDDEISTNYSNNETINQSNFTFVSQAELLWLDQDDPFTSGTITITVVDVTSTACKVDVNGETSDWFEEDDVVMINNRIVQLIDIDNPNNKCRLKFGLSDTFRLPDQAGYECSVYQGEISLGDITSTQCKIYEDGIYNWITEESAEDVTDVNVYAIVSFSGTYSPSCGSSGSISADWCDVIAYPECSDGANNDDDCCNSYDGGNCGDCVGGYCLDENEGLLDYSCVDSGPNQNKYEVNYRDYDCSSHLQCSFTEQTVYVGSCCIDAGDCSDSNECTTDTCSSNQCSNIALSNGTSCSLGTCQGGTCTTCGNSVCNEGESISCPADCLCGNGVCNEGEEVSCPQECICHSNSDCEFGFYCDFDLNSCVAYEDKCTNYGDYFCNFGDVYQCTETFSYYDEKLIDTCLLNEQCNPATVNSTAKCINSSVNIWIDFASPGLAVNKQKGDKLIVNIYSQSSVTGYLSYNTTAFTGNCPSGSYSLNSGLNSCYLNVTDDAIIQDYDLKIGNKSTTVNVIDNPSLLIVTNSDKLFQRFQSEEQGVYDVLRQAYWNAFENGIVYDLSDYTFESSHPFVSFDGYNEKLLTPSHMDNDYTTEISNFVKEKCGACEDIMIVGDDFVVPHYRREIPTREQEWFVFSEESIENIYTDISYSKKSSLQFSNYYEMFQIEGKYEGKEVLLILPSDMDENMTIEIARLKQSFVGSGYNPDYSNISGQEVYCYDDTWWSAAKGKTLIIIGTEENNNAFKCMPFIEGDIDGAFIQPNVWDNSEYALVINTDDSRIVEAFSIMVENGTIVNLKGESAYFYKIGVQYVSYAAMGVGIGSLIVFSGGTAAPALLLTAGAALDTVADAGDLTDTCFVNYDGMGACKTSAFFVLIPFASGPAANKITRTFDDAVLNGQLFNLFSAVDDKIVKYFKKLRGIDIIGDGAFEAVVKTADDNVYLAKGADKIFEGSEDVEGLIDSKIKFLGHESDELIKLQRATYIKSVGKIDTKIDEISDPNLKNALRTKFEDLFDDIQNEVNPGNAKGLRGEIESLSHENLDGVQDIRRKIYNSELGISPADKLYTDLDISRTNGVLVESKFHKSWTNVQQDIEEQAEKLDKIQEEILNKPDADIIFRQKIADIGMNSQSQIDSTVPQYVKDMIISQRNALQKSNIYLELIDVEGTLWRVNI